MLGEPTFPYDLQPNRHDNLMFRCAYNDVLFLSKKELMVNRIEQLNYPLTPQPTIHHNHSPKLTIYTPPPQQLSNPKTTQTIHPYHNHHSNTTLPDHPFVLALTLHQPHMSIMKQPIPKIFDTNQPDTKTLIQQPFTPTPTHNQRTNLVPLGVRKLPTYTSPKLPNTE